MNQNSPHDKYQNYIDTNELDNPTIEHDSDVYPHNSGERSGTVNLGSKSTSRRRRVAFRIDLAGIHRTEPDEHNDNTGPKDYLKKSARISRKKGAQTPQTPSRKRLKKKTPVLFSGKKIYPDLDTEFNPTEKLKLAHMHNISTRSDFVRHCNSEFE